MKIKIVGTAPLLMHSDRTAIPTHPDAEWLSEISKRRNKSTDDLIELSRREWLCGMYHKAGLPDMPIDNIHSCIYAAAKRRREGPLFAGNFIVTSASFVVPDAPGVSPDDLWKISHDKKDERNYVDLRSVRIGNSKIGRTRPVFHTWEIDVTAEVHQSDTGKTVDEFHVEQWLQIAGRSIGLGDYRPQKGGLFGLFNATIED